MRRTTTRCMILGLAFLIGLTACKGKKSSTTAMGKGGLPAFYERIPADSPFVMASIDGYSDEMVEHYMTTAQPLLEEAFGALGKYAEQMGEDGKALQVLVEAFAGKLDRAGLESIGLDLHGHGAFYALGLYPVINWQLKDSAAFKGFMQGILDKYGIKPVVATVATQEYWILFKDEQVAFAMAFPKGEMVAVMTGPEDHGWAMEYALGIKKPERSMAEDPIVLRAVEKYGFNRTHIGYLDLRIAAQLVMGDATGELAQRSRAGFKLDLAPTDVCKKEIYGLISYGPRILFGMTHWSKEQYTAQVTWETEQPDLFKALGEVATAVPGIDLDVKTPRKAMFGVGLDFEKGYELLLDRLAAARKEPYQCPELADLNETIAESETAMRVAPVPPAVRGLLGAQGTLYDLELTSGTPTRIEAAIVIRHRDPESLVALARMAVPELANVTLPDDGSTVAIPLGSVMPIPGLTNVKAARKGELLAVGMGSAADSFVAKLVAGVPDDEHLMGFAMDYGWVGTLVSEMSEGGEQPFDMSKLYRGNYAMVVDSDDKGLHLRVSYADSAGAAVIAK